MLPYSGFENIAGVNDCRLKGSSRRDIATSMCTFVRVLPTHMHIFAGLSRRRKRLRAAVILEVVYVTARHGRRSARYSWAEVAPLCIDLL